MTPSRCSGSTGVDEARDALGRRLRELRKQARMTGQQLAESLSWPPSKVSKLENGRQTPSDDDIRGWTRVTGSDQEAEALLASLHTLEVQHAEWQRVLKAGMKAHQHELISHDDQVIQYRVFEPVFIPGLLQTPDYAHARFAQAAALHQTPNDVSEAVQTRMKRQEVLYRLNKRFHFVLTEAALRYRLCEPDVMLGQLDRLVTLAALPNVRLGVIANATRFAVDPRHGFWLLNNDLVRVETYSAELNLRQPHEIELYSTIFDRHAAVASYGRPARGIITTVIDELAAAAPDEQ